MFFFLAGICSLVQCLWITLARPAKEKQSILRWTFVNCTAVKKFYNIGPRKTLHSARRLKLSLCAEKPNLWLKFVFYSIFILTWSKKSFHIRQLPMMYCTMQYAWLIKSLINQLFFKLGCCLCPIESSCGVPLFESEPRRVLKQWFLIEVRSHTRFESSDFAERCDFNRNSSILKFLKLW